MHQLHVVRSDGLTVRYVWAEHRDPDRVSALIRDALAAQGGATVPVPRSDGRAEFVMGDAIEVNSGQVVVTLRVLEDLRAQWEAWRADAEFNRTAALGRLAELVANRSKLTDRQLAAVAELIELGNALEATHYCDPREKGSPPLPDRIAHLRQLSEWGWALRDALDSP